MVEVYEDRIGMLEVKVEGDTVVAKKAEKELKETRELLRKTRGDRRAWRALRDDKEGVG